MDEAGEQVEGVENAKVNTIEENNNNNNINEEVIDKDLNIEKIVDPPPTINSDLASNEINNSINIDENNYNKKRKEKKIRRAKTAIANQNKSTSSTMSSTKSISKDKESTTTKTNKSDSSNKNKKPEWNTYFSFMNDREKEKLMQLPELPKPLK